MYILQAELEEWKQAASVEAGLRRELLARAVKAEAKLERLQMALERIVDRQCLISNTTEWDSGYSAATEACIDIALDALSTGEK